MSKYRDYGDESDVGYHFVDNDVNVHPSHFRDLRCLDLVFWDAAFRCLVFL